MPLFERVAYTISESLPAHARDEIARMLDANGATEVALDCATHVVSGTVEFEGADTLRKDVACVSPYWVERTMELGLLQDPKYFSADQDLIFSGIVATSAGIPPGDKEVIAAGIKDGGGQWREGLTRDVNHLFVTNTQSEKYQTAMHFRDRTHIHVLLPQWFDQCWNMQMRLPPDMFAFPEPPFLHKNHDLAAYKAQMLIKKNAMDGTNKSAMYHSMQLADGSSPLPATDPSSPKPWQGRAILLSSSLGLDAPRREAVGTRIIRAGGTIVAPEEDEDESAAVGRANVLVTRYRAGPTYAKALAEGKTIGTLAWLFYVERTGVMSRPRDQLLHYPVRNKPIDGFADHVITVTNYQGDARDYLKKLIEVMGAKFTPTMSGKNTIVIAAYKSGNKTGKAEEWSVPIVTHKWLEDCFVDWRNLTPAQKKYLDYAPGVNYGTVLGERGVGRVGLEEDPELPPEKKEASRAKERKDGAVSKGVAEKKPVSKDESVDVFVATGTSAREAREVEEVENVLDLGDDLDYGPDEFQKASPISPTKVGPPRGVKKTPGKGSVPTSVAATPKSRPKPKPVSSGATAVDDQHDSPSKPQKEKAALKKAIVVYEDDMDKADELRKKPKARPILSKTSALEHEHSEDENSVPHGKAKAPLKRKAQVVHSDDDVPETTKAPVKKKARQMTPITVDSDASGVINVSPRVKPKSSPKTYKSKTKTKAPAAPESESDEVEEVPRKKKATVSKTLDKVNSREPARGYIPSPNRVVSVDLPDPRSLITSAKSRARVADRDLDSGLKKTSSPEKLPRTASLRAAAYEEPQSSPQRGRPSIRQASDVSRSPSPSPRRSPRRLATSSRGPTNPNAAKAAPATSRSSSPLPSPPPLQRTPSRRSAAALATQKLRDEVMPDVMIYQNERKRAKDHRRKSSTSKAGVFNGHDEERSEDDVRGAKRRKVDKDEGPGKKNLKAARTHGTDEPDVQTAFVAHIKEKRAEAGTRKKIRAESASAEEGSGDEKGSKFTRNPKLIRILCTKVELPDETKKAIEKLGPKFTTKVTDCTHLVGSSFARTEKFLCGLTNASFVLHAEWLEACAKKKKIVGERDYYLKDPASEAKHHFKLVDALERAKELRRKKEKLLQNRFFYITPRVPIEYNLLKGVLRTLGAECSKASTVSSRNLSSTRYLISCPDDEKIWRGLADHGHPVYNHELVLMGALSQYIDWDGEMKRVPGSL